MSGTGDPGRLRRVPAGAGPAAMDPAVVAQVDERLAGVVRDHGVAVPWAIESGSRAWGFPSPDSDYDCRFLFVRPREDYLSPWRPRDVIETPLDAVLDVNGWDLLKAVDLVVRGNATVGEWLRSPIVYDGDPAFAADLTALAEETADRAATRRHYLHVAQAQWQAGAGREQPVRLKRVLYGLRPALCVRWLDEHPEHVTPPMALAELVAQTSLPADLVEAVDELVERKSRTRELGEAVVASPVAGFLDAVVAEADGPGGAGGEAAYGREERRRAARDRFVAMVERFAPVMWT